MFICSRCKKKKKKMHTLVFLKFSEIALEILFQTFKLNWIQNHIRKGIFYFFFKLPQSRVRGAIFPSSVLADIRSFEGFEWTQTITPPPRFCLQVLYPVNSGPREQISQSGDKRLQLSFSQFQNLLPPPPYLNNFIQKGLLAKFFTFFMVYDLFIE